MNALKFLMEDHNKAKDLLEKIVNTSENETKSRQELFIKLKHALTTHQMLEEKIFYPHLTEFPETRPLALESYEEHAIVSELLQKIEQEDSFDSDEVTAKFNVLKEVVEKHIQEEEEELFPKVEEVVSKSHLDEMGKNMLKLKEEETIDQ